MVYPIPKGARAGRYPFAMLYKALFDPYRHPEFYQLSTLAKVLYCFMSDESSWAFTRHQVKPDGTPFIYFTIVRICELLNVKRDKAMSLLKELEDFGLIHKERQGVGQPDRIIVHEFIGYDDSEMEKEDQKIDVSFYNGHQNYRSEISTSQVDKTDSTGRENRPVQVDKTDSSNTYSNTFKNDIGFKQNRKGNYFVQSSVPYMDYETYEKMAVCPDEDEEDISDEALW